MNDIIKEKLDDFCEENIFGLGILNKQFSKCFNEKSYLNLIN